MLFISPDERMQDKLYAKYFLVHPYNQSVEFLTGKHIENGPTKFSEFHK